MPCGAGFHPYIPERFAHRIRFDATTFWQRGADTYSIARTLDDGPITQYYRGFAGNLNLTTERGDCLSIAADEALRHLVLHRPPPGSRNNFCVEPVPHVADAANVVAQGRGGTGWKTLEPGQSLLASIHLTARPVLQEELLIPMAWLASRQHRTIGSIG